MNIRQDYLNGKFSGYKTSLEILQSIAEFTRSEPGSKKFQTEWENGHNSDSIIKRAWELSDKDTETLFWGEEVIERRVITRGTKKIV